MKRVQIGIQNYKLKFDKSYNGELFAVQGDTGRVIKAQVVDELDKVVNITGLTLEFYIGNAEQVSMVTGTIEDAINGIFKIEIVSGQLVYPGLQQAQFVLKDANGKVGSKLIDIWIEESIENGATTGRNVILDFSVFDEAVALLRDLDFATAKQVSDTLAVQVAEANAFQDSFASNLTLAEQIQTTLTNAVNSATAVDGAIKQKTDVIDGWIANPEQFKGDKGDPFTYEDFTVAQIEGLKVKGGTGATGATGAAARVTATGTDANGNTTVTFNDGTTITVTKGADGTMTFEDLTPEQIESLRGIDGAPGADGKSVEFHWNGTQLGIRKQGETSYTYVDLKGKDGINATTTEVATPTSDGLMSKEDKIKVKAIPENPKYTDTTYTAGTNISISNNKISVTDVVTSVAGKTGAVTITKTDVGLSNVANYFSYANVFLTESAYAALSTKDPNTLYIRPKA